MKNLSEQWVIFYDNNMKEVCRYTMAEESDGERQATKEMIASERGITADEITCMIELVYGG